MTDVTIEAAMMLETAEPSYYPSTNLQDWLFRVLDKQANEVDLC